MPTLIWHCRDGVVLTPDASGALQVRVDGGAPTRHHVGAAVARALARVNEGASEAELAAAVGEDAAALPMAYYVKLRLQALGLLVATLVADGRPLLTLRRRRGPFDADHWLRRARQRPAGRSRISRFAWLRCADGAWRLEGTEAACHVVVRDPEVLAWLHAAAEPVAPTGAGPRDVTLALLAELGLMDEADTPEPASRQPWEWHDRVFHQHAWDSGLCARVGGTYRFLRAGEDGPTPTLTPPPAIRPPHPGETVPLPVPDPDPADPDAADPDPADPDGASRPLRAVMESRRSRRDMADRPVALADVAALLHRVARIEATLPSTVQTGLRRPYPSGGAIHELEFYLAVRACADLAAGFYHYRGDAHALTRLPNGASAARRVAAHAASGWGRPDAPPHCVVVIASRLPRLAWKYEGIAYRVSLLNAGVALQSLALVAEDLGLNGAPVGMSRADLFAEATGVDTWEEISLLEYGLGRRPNLA